MLLSPFLANCRLSLDADWPAVAPCTHTHTTVASLYLAHNQQRPGITAQLLYNPALFTPAALTISYLFTSTCPDIHIS